MVLVRPGPFPIMLEFGGVPCADGVGLDVQISAETAVRSVDIILRSLLPGEAPLVSLDIVERRIASEIQSAVHKALAARSLGEFAHPGGRSQLLVEVKDAVTQALARIGLGLESLEIIRVSSEGLDDVLKERGAAAVERIEVETLGTRIGNDVARREALLDHAERVETIEQKRKFILMQAVAREAEVEVHSASSRERVAKHLRAIEHALGVERIVNDADLRALEATRKDEATYSATVRAIALRAKVAEHEWEELERELRAASRRAEERRRDELAGAKHTKEVAEINSATAVAVATGALAIKKAEDDQRLAQKAGRG